MFGILFFLVIHIFSAKDINSKYSYLVDEELANIVSDSLTSDQTNSYDLDKAIYVTSGVTIVDGNKDIKGQIVIVDSPASISRIKKIAKKKSVKKIAINTYRFVKKESPENIVYVNPSSKNNIFYSNNESYNRAVVPSQTSSTKYILKHFSLVCNDLFTALFQKESFDFYGQFAISKFQSFISGRAPPVFS